MAPLGGASAEEDLWGQLLDQAANAPTASLMAVQIQNIYAGSYHNLDDENDNTVLLRTAVPCYPCYARCKEDFHAIAELRFCDELFCLGLRPSGGGKGAVAGAGVGAGIGAIWGADKEVPFWHAVNLRAPSTAES